MPGSPVTSSLRQGLRYFFRAENLQNFSGGLNLRDAPTELSPTESPDLWNVTLDERGGVGKRLGSTRWNASAATNVITYMYPSAVVDKILHYSKADGKLYYDVGDGVLHLARTWTASNRISIVDFAGSVYAVHPIDGLYASTDGITWTLVVATFGTVPVGDLIITWTNKLWISGDPNQKDRLYFCGPGDATDWSNTSPHLAGSNDIREKDESGIVAMAAGMGFDQQTQPALVVCKGESTYRVTDAATGSYITLDSKVGAASAQSLVSLYGKVNILSKHGIFQTDGFSPLVSVSERIQPQFTAAAIDYSKLDQFCGSHQGDRLYFSLTRTGSATNDLALEYHPLVGWITAGSNAMACYCVYNKNTEILLGSSPTVTGRVYRLNSGGSDDGTAIESRFLTRVFEPNGGSQARLQQIRVLKRGTFQMTVLPDFATGGTEVTIEAGSGTSGFAWGSGIWGAGVWGGSPKIEDYQRFRPRLIGRAFQIRIDETSSVTQSAPNLIETGVSRTVGGWSLYELELQFAPLGLS